MDKIAVSLDVDRCQFPSDSEDDFCIYFDVTVPDWDKDSILQGDADYVSKAIFQLCTNSLNDSSDLFKGCHVNSMVCPKGCGVDSLQKFLEDNEGCPLSFHLLIQGHESYDDWYAHNVKVCKSGGDLIG